ncbi:hypothetical protein PMIN06_009704 [Paraphaeosphaeria minitans]
MRDPSSHSLPSKVITTDMFVLDARQVVTSPDKPRPTPPSTSLENPIITDEHDCKIIQKCEGAPCFDDLDCDPWLTCNHNDAHCRSTKSTVSSATGGSENAITSLTSTAASTSESRATSAIPIPTMLPGPTSTRGDTTLSTLWASLGNSTFVSTTISTLTLVQTLSPTLTPTAVAIPPPPAHNRVLTYIAIPLTLVPLFILALVCFIRWRRTHRKPIPLDASLAAQTSMRSKLPPAGFGEKEGAWTGRGHREYRRSGGTAGGKSVRVSAGTATSRGGVRMSGGKESGRVSAWLDGQGESYGRM